MNTDELKKYLESTPLEDMKVVFEVLSERLWKKRLENKGFLPQSIFNAVMGMGGTYATVIALPRIQDESGNTIGYAHKLREAGDDGWEGYYHQPGTLVRTTQPDPYSDALVRLTQEFFGTQEKYQGKKITDLGFSCENIPPAFIWEAFRKSVAVRIAFFIDVPVSVFEDKMKGLSGKKWILVKDPFACEINIIPFELKWLQWALHDTRIVGSLILPKEDMI